MRLKIIGILVLLIVGVGCTIQNKEQNSVEEKNSIGWEELVAQKIKLLGHRNWIVIADAAYPLQSSEGITTVLSDKSQLETLKCVKNLIDNQKHIKPLIFLDKEIDLLGEKNAKGITEYRNELSELFADKNPKKMLHEDIIKRLDEASEQFNVIIIKTNFTIPYTSVFFELDCKYWNKGAELELREKLKK